MQYLSDKIACIFVLDSHLKMSADPAEKAKAWYNLKTATPVFTDKQDKSRGSGCKGIYE
jgi:hypothetical protein